MGLFSRAGNIVRQISQKHLNQEIAASKPSIFQMIRCMSSTEVYVTGISKKTDDASLREAFKSYGDVAEARVIHLKYKDFGFVTYNSTEAATAAIQGMDGQKILGRRIKVNDAAEKPKSSEGSGRGGGGIGSGRVLCGGGYGGNTYRRILCGGGYGGNKYEWNTYGANGTRYNNSLIESSYIGYRLGQCVILQFPKITYIHHFVLPQPEKKKFGVNKRPEGPGKAKGQWWPSGKVGPIRCLEKVLNGRGANRKKSVSHSTTATSSGL